MIPPLPQHGGGLVQARLRWPDAPAPWLDLSTGINPHPYALPPLAPDLWHRLPDQHLEDALTQAARDHYGLPAHGAVLATPGSGAAIRALPTTLPTGRVALLGPTYGEHEAAWRNAGHHVEICRDLSQMASAPVAVVVNPNNPDGRIIPPLDLLDFAHRHPQTLLVVDQAFGDTAPELSLIPHVPGNAVILTSFGKFFGLAGLRLGLVFAHPHHLTALTARLGPWPVSGPALAIAAQALAHQDWIAATRQALHQQTSALDRVLNDAGLCLAGGTPLFRLISHPRAHDLWDHLGRHGILTRVFSYRTDWLRLGLPADAVLLQRLSNALRQPFQ